jgi:hypothetical protein
LDKELYAFQKEREKNTWVALAVRTNVAADLVLLENWRRLETSWKVVHFVLSTPFHMLRKRGE